MATWRQNRTSTCLLRYGGKFDVLTGVLRQQQSRRTRLEMKNAISPKSPEFIRGCDCKYWPACRAKSVMARPDLTYCKLNTKCNSRYTETRSGCCGLRVDQVGA